MILNLAETCHDKTILVGKANSVSVATYILVSEDTYARYESGQGGNTSKTGNVPNLVYCHS